MNVNQIINMVVRIVVQKLIRSGVNAAANRMGKGKESAAPTPGASETQKRAKQTMKMMRRLR